MSAGSSLEEQCLEMYNTCIQVLLAMFMAEAGKCFLSLVMAFFAYWQRLILLAAPLMLLVADVLYTWTAAKPDQAETLKWLRKNCSLFFCHLLA